MTQNLIKICASWIRLLGLLMACALYVVPAKAGNLNRARKKRQEVAMLSQDIDTSLEQQLGIPQSSSAELILYDENPVDTESDSVLISEEELGSDQLLITAQEPEPVADEIELYFENADLQNFVQQIQDIFDVVFITDDAFDPLPQGAKSLKGNKISYRTFKPISRTQVWSTFNTFLNIAGFTIVPHTNDRTYRITSLTTAQKAPLHVYIGTDSSTLPDSDELIRYVYFIENNTVDAIRAVVEQFRSTASTAVYLNEHKGFILTDIAYNIKKLMEIVKELDKISMPESLSVLKLKRTDAKTVKELYDTLTQKEDNRYGPRPPMMGKRQPDALALPENVTLIAEPRTNSLILLGPQNARERIEQFIIKNVDVELDQAYSPLHTYQLHYANAETIAKIMNDVSKFGENTEAGKSGGVRGGDQYMRPISFVAEPATNRLIIKGHYDDYLKAVDVIKSLDVDQPQVAIEVLILSVDIAKAKELGTQLRSKANGGTDGFFGNNVKFQTSGLYRGESTASPIVQKTNDTPGVKRLLGNILDVVVGAPAGNTIITLGQDLCNVWGIMQLLETVTNVQLVSNPFLIATNNTPAEVSLGETRRVVLATALASSSNQENLESRGNDSANLVVKVTPQINSDGMILLDLDITIDNFTSVDPTSPTKNTKNIKTSATLANKQILALGGLVRNKISNGMSKTPLLGDIPLLGWFFKNKRKQEEKQNLLILVSTRIIEPTNPEDLALYNKKHTDEYRGTLSEVASATEQRDPIHKVFFEAGYDSTEKMIDDFIFERRTGRGSNPRTRKIRKQKDAELAQRKQKQQEIQERLLFAQTERPAIKKQKRSQTPILTQTSATAREPIAKNTPSISNNTPQKIAHHDLAKPKQSSVQSKKRTNLALTQLLPTDTKGALA